MIAVENLDFCYGQSDFRLQMPSLVIEQGSRDLSRNRSTPLWTLLLASTSTAATTMAIVLASTTRIPGESWGHSSGLTEICGTLPWRRRLRGVSGSLT